MRLQDERTAHSFLSRLTTDIGEKREKFGLRAVEDLGGGAFAGADGAVHCAVRLRCGLGSGPVHSREGLAEQMPVPAEVAGPQVRERTAARPLFGEPRCLDE